MKDQARVVIVGGGVYGVSLAYHLTKFGWQDVVLVEKGELTSAQTWHAAGFVNNFGFDYNTMYINNESVKLYKTLQEETVQDVGWRTSGTLRLVESDHQFDNARAAIS